MNKSNYQKIMRTQQRDVCNELIEELGNSLCLLSLAIICDKFTDGNGNTFTPKKIMNLYNYVNEEKQKWSLSENDDVKELVRIAKTEKEFIYQSCKQIPFTNFLKLARINAKRSAKDLNLRMYLECGYCICMVWLDDVLKKHYRLNLENRIDFVAYMVDFIDSIARGYVTIDSFEDFFIEEYGWNIRTGEII